MPIDRKNLEEARKYLKKKHGDALEIDERRDAVSTGSYAVDVITGIGGFPRGRITEVAGPFSSGKTTLGITACAAAQLNGLYPVFVDVEQALDMQYAGHLGFNFKDGDKGMVTSPRTAEATLQIVERMVQAGADLILIDSVAAMIPEKDLEGEIGDQSTVAGRARVLSKELPRLNNEIRRHQAAVVFINQYRSTMSQGSGFASGQEETAGGYAFKYFASMRIRLKQTRKSSATRKSVDVLGKEREVPVASTHEAELSKSKVSSPFRKIEFTIRFDEERQVYGIDNVQTLLDAARNRGIIEQAGSWLKFGDEVKVQGDAALYDYALRTPGFMKTVKQKLVEAGVLPWLTGA